MVHLLNSRNLVNLHTQALRTSEIHHSKLGHMHLKKTARTEKRGQHIQYTTGPKANILSHLDVS
jgi:hypothetical protein